MTIDHTLSKQAADALFDDEAVLFGTANGIPEYRIVEIFGEWAGVFIEQNARGNGSLDAGKDYNAWRAVGAKHPTLRYLYRAGYYKIVSEHNYRLSWQAHRSSAAGKVVDALWQTRHKRLEAQEGG